MAHTHHESWNVKLACLFESNYPNIYNWYVHKSIFFSVDLVCIDYSLVDSDYSVFQVGCPEEIKKGELSLFVQVTTAE